tara:strand:+ start:324 stop:818 length:495 start_codon:yes stop_codon:yes gene_type:complete
MKLFIASLVIILFGFVIIRFESPGDRQQLSELAVVLLITLLAVSVISWLASGFLIRRIRADLPIKKEKILFLSKYSISSTSLLYFTPILLEVLTNTYPIDSTQLCYLLGIIILGSKILMSSVISYRKKPNQESKFLILVTIFYALLAIILLTIFVIAIAASAYT